MTEIALEYYIKIEKEHKEQEVKIKELEDKIFKKDEDITHLVSSIQKLQEQNEYLRSKISSKNEQSTPINKKIIINHYHNKK